MGRNRSKYPKEPTRWQEIETVWSGPMANTVNTRIRFALWELAGYLADVAGKTSKTAKAEILRQLELEKSQYDEQGRRKFHL